ncbi:MAG: dipicolinate synthase subunit B [Defluviitaleaceae bacterium]|nr:dipicolinate synthase subunit B [Defluviitaleaceae bacterium]
MDLKGKKIGFGITASFCTILDILKPMEELKKQGADIYPIVSDNVYQKSSRFHDRDDFLQKVKEITGRDVISTITEAETLGPDNPMDIMVIAPATGSTMAKLANGISDNALLLATKATIRNGKPILIALFTNDALGMNYVNIAKLYNTKNFYFVPYGQDNPIKKPTSMTADLSKLQDALAAALDGKQIQPAIV